jgi:hypothetical protein
MPGSISASSGVSSGPGSGSTQVQDPGQGAGIARAADNRLKARHGFADWGPEARLERRPARGGLPEVPFSWLAVADGGCRIWQSRPGVATNSGWDHRPEALSLALGFAPLMGSMFERLTASCAHLPTG